MEQIGSIETIAQVIQLSVAPVFLIAGIGALLSVLSTRLGRIIDRAREIERRMLQAGSSDQQQLLGKEAASLWSRVRLTNWAIRLCVTGALMVCLVIVALFIGAVTAFNLSVLIATFFVAAMLFVISGLSCLLREVGISTRRTRQGMESLLEGMTKEHKPPSRTA